MIVKWPWTCNCCSKTFWFALNNQHHKLRSLDRTTKYQTLRQFCTKIHFQIQNKAFHFKVTLVETVHYTQFQISDTKWSDLVDVSPHSSAYHVTTDVTANLHSKLGGVVVRASDLWSRAREFGSQQVRCQVVLGQLSLPSLQVGKSSTGLLAGIKVECINLCRVAGNTAWFHMADDIP